MMRSFLLAPCLLICLACATPIPFPLESLEEGMTTETVRENFGAPEATNRRWDIGDGPAVINGPAVLTGVSWTYVHGIYVYEMPIVLDFEEEKLVRWEVLPLDPVVRTIGWQGWKEGGWLWEAGPLADFHRRQDQRFWTLMMDYQQHKKDENHHKKGHTHHHGHK